MHAFVIHDIHQASNQRRRFGLVRRVFVVLSCEMVGAANDTSRRGYNSSQARHCGRLKRSPWGLSGWCIGEERIAGKFDPGEALQLVAAVCMR